MISNGEGYRETQNTNSSGMDVSSRFSIEPMLGVKTKTGLHLFYRKENAFGFGGNECFEGKTNCLPNDLNPATSLSRQIQSLQSDTFGSESNLIWNGFLTWNLGLGGILKNKTVEKSEIDFSRLHLRSLSEKTVSERRYTFGYP